MNRRDLFLALAAGAIESADVQTTSAGQATDREAETADPEDLAAASSPSSAGANEGLRHLARATRERGREASTAGEPRAVAGD